MNGKVKFHKATGPAFNAGEVWISANGVKVEVVSVQKYPGATGDHTSDYGVTYKTDPVANPQQINGKSATNQRERCLEFPSSLHAPS